MMKKMLAPLLIMLFALPVFLQVMPHGVDHTLHEFKAHHTSTHHGHSHDNHHDHKTHDENHHAINLDVVTFYTDYLHADLLSPEQVVVDAPSQDIQDIGHYVTASVASIMRDELFPSQSRAPPDWRSLRAENTPVYLSTLRLRI